jgi:hypothetical protein
MRMRSGGDVVLPPLRARLVVLRLRLLSRVTLHEGSGWQGRDDGDLQPPSRGVVVRRQWSSCLVYSTLDIAKDWAPQMVMESHKKDNGVMASWRRHAGSIVTRHDNNSYRTKKHELFCLSPGSSSLQLVLSGACFCATFRSHCRSANHHTPVQI